MPRNWSQLSGCWTLPYAAELYDGKKRTVSSTVNLCGTASALHPVAAKTPSAGNYRQRVIRQPAAAHCWRFSPSETCLSRPSICDQHRRVLRRAPSRSRQRRAVARGDWRHWLPDPVRTGPAMPGHARAVPAAAWLAICPWALVRLQALVDLTWKTDNVADSNGWLGGRDCRSLPADSDIVRPFAAHSAWLTCNGCCYRCRNTILSSRLVRKERPVVLCFCSPLIVI